MAFNIWDWKKPENHILKGKLVGKLFHQKPFNKTIYAVEQDNGVVVHFFGTYVTHGFLATTPLLTKIKIRFLGKGFIEEGDKHQGFLFDIEVLELAPHTTKAARIEKSLSKLKQPSNNIKKAPRGK